jgi:hypothetical protein
MASTDMKTRIPHARKPAGGCILLAALALSSVACSSKRAIRPSDEVAPLHAAITDKALATSNDAVNDRSRGWPRMNAPAEPEMEQLELEDAAAIELDDDSTATVTVDEDRLVDDVGWNDEDDEPTLGNAKAKAKAKANTKVLPER